MTKKIVVLALSACLMTPLSSCASSHRASSLPEQVVTETITQSAPAVAGQKPGPRGGVVPLTIDQMKSSYATVAQAVSSTIYRSDSKIDSSPRDALARTENWWFSDSDYKSFESKVPSSWDKTLKPMSDVKGFEMASSSIDPEIVPTPKDTNTAYVQIDTSRAWVDPSTGAENSIGQGVLLFKMQRASASSPWKVKQIF